jgi:hypothetical protein
MHAAFGRRQQEHTCHRNEECPIAEQESELFDALYASVFGHLLELGQIPDHIDSWQDGES